MILKEWNVWHCYSTYALFDIRDLTAAARLLVESGLVEIAMVQSGEIWWRDERKAKSGHVWAEPSMKPTATVHFPAGMPVYVMECTGRGSVESRKQRRGATCRLTTEPPWLLYRPCIGFSSNRSNELLNGTDHHWPHAGRRMTQDSTRIFSHVASRPGFTQRIEPSARSSRSARAIVGLLTAGNTRSRSA